MLTDTLDRMQRETRLPEIDGEQCVHAYCAEATCRGCIAACPHGAWVRDDDFLGIDTTACDGCSRCIPACPVGALWFTAPAKPAKRLERGDIVAFAACDRAGVKQAEGVVPCLHALGLGELLALHKAGVKRLVLGSGDCATCPRAQGGAPTIDQTIDDLNRLLASRSLAPVPAVRRSAERWSRQFDDDTDPLGGPTVGRRAFFRFAATRVVAEAAQVAAPTGERPAFVPPGTMLPQPRGLFPFAPEISDEHCAGCDACVRICPHGALSFDGGNYRIDAAACTGCGLCRDVCQFQAVTVTAMAGDVRDLVPLDSTRCRACGTPFHVPAGRLPESGLCRICGKTNHHRNLFQVLP